MKKYYIKVYHGSETEYEQVLADANTFDSGFIIFWSLESENKWNQLSMYPSSRTVIYKIEDNSPLTAVSMIIPEQVEKVETIKEQTVRKKKTK